MRIARSIFTLALVTALAPPLGAQRPEIRARIDAYVKALSSGSVAQFEAMAKDHFTPELLARNTDQRPRMVGGGHADFGELAIAGEDVTSPTHVDVAMKSGINSMPLTIAMDFEAAPPFRIAGVALRAGGPAGGRGGRGGPPPIAAPPIDARMSDADPAAPRDGHLAGPPPAPHFPPLLPLPTDGKTLFA